MFLKNQLKLKKKTSLITVTLFLQIENTINLHLKIKHLKNFYNHLIFKANKKKIKMN